MPRKLPPNFGDIYAAVARELQGDLGDAVAQRAGAPLDVPVVPATEADRVEAWTTPHPEATDEAMWALAQQKYAEHTTAGMPPRDAERATAEDLTHFKFRARKPLYSLGTTSSAEQVKEAERLKSAAARRARDGSGGADGGGRLGDGARGGGDRAGGAGVVTGGQQAAPPDAGAAFGGDDRGY